MKNNFGAEDPYFEQVPATRLDGRPTTKTKKRRKALPAGISEHDGKVLTKVKRRAHRLDMSLFSLCGIRFGWSSLIGIFPGVGDALDAFMALMVLRTCEQVEGGLPQDVKYKMYFNIMLDFGIGLVPFLGDLADAVFKANTRNAVELEKYLRKKGAANLKAQGQAVAVIDPSDPHEYDRQLVAERGPPPGYTATPGTRQANVPPAGPAEPAYQPQARMPNEKSGGGSWFSGLFGRTKQQDLETGTSHAGHADQAGHGRDAALPSLPPQQPQQTGTLRSQRQGY